MGHLNDVTESQLTIRRGESESPIRMAAVNDHPVYRAKTQRSAVVKLEPDQFIGRYQNQGIKELTFPVSSIKKKNDQQGETERQDRDAFILW